ncbi:MAG: HepT-like ribonuclease domain-containing protein [Microthrixaceae bacterium]
MTPPRIDISIVQRRLQLIEGALESLRSLGEIDEAQLRSDVIRRAAAERLIQVVVDLAFDINGHVAVAQLGRAPETGRQSFLDLAELGVLTTELAEVLAPLAGLRNILVHNYVDVRVDLVATSVGLLLELFPEYVRSIARSIIEPDR